MEKLVIGLDGSFFGISSASSAKKKTSNEERIEVPVDDKVEKLEEKQRTHSFIALDALVRNLVEIHMEPLIRAIEEENAPEVDQDALNSEYLKKQQELLKEVYEKLANKE